MLSRRTFLRVLPAIGAGLAALPHLAQRAFGMRQQFVYTAENEFGALIDRTDPVEFVDVHLTRHGTLSSLVQVALENRWGIELGRSDKVDASLIATTGQWVRFPFRAAPLLRSNRTYWLAVREVRHG